MPFRQISCTGAVRTKNAIPADFVHGGTKDDMQTDFVHRGCAHKSVIKTNLVHRVVRTKIVMTAKDAQVNY